LHPGTSRMVPLWIPFAQRGRANGFIFAAAGAGIAGVTIIFGYIIDWFGWRSAFLILGTITALLAVVWVWYATDRPAQHPSVNAAELSWIEGDKDPQDQIATDGAHIKDISQSMFDPSSGRGSNSGFRMSKPRSWTWWRLLRNRSLICLTVSYGAVGYFQYLFFYWMNHYFVRVRGLNQEDSRLYSSIPLAAMELGMLLGGWLSV